MAQQNYDEEITKNKHTFKPIFSGNLLKGLKRHKIEQVQQSHHNNKEDQLHFQQFSPNIQSINDHSFDQPSFQHLNYSNKHKSPRLFNLCLNPELQSQQGQTNIRQLEEVNRSVKQIMRCNQEYRGELLSAYQNKTKIQLQNAILIKQRQCLLDQKETLCCQLEEQRKKVIILEKSIQRLKENHVKVNQKLKNDVQELHKELNHLRNTRYDLENRSNQNALLMKRIQGHQCRIGTLEKELQKASGQNLQLVSQCAMMKDKYSTCNSQKNTLILLTMDQKKAIQTSEVTMKKMQNQIDNLNAKYRAITYQYENFKRQNHYQKHNSQRLLEKLQLAEKNEQERCKQLETNQQQYQRLIQAFLSLKSQNDKLFGLTFELETIKNINQSLIEEINKKQTQIQESNSINAQLMKKLQYAQSQYARLVHESEYFKSSSEDNARNVWHDYQNQKNYLKYRYESQVNVLKGTISQLSSQIDKLAKAVQKKQDIIKEKENQICHHIANILQLQQKTSALAKENQTNKKIHQQKISILQASLNNHQALIKSLEQAIHQLKAQNSQSLKRQLAKIAQKDTHISILQNNLKQTYEQSKMILQKFNEQRKKQEQSAHQRQNLLKSQLSTSIANIDQLQREINVQAQKILSMNKQLQAKSSMIAQTSSENQKLNRLNQDLKGQIAVIQAEYDIIENELKQQRKQRQELCRKLQRQQRKAQKLLTLNQRYACQIQGLKLNLSSIQSRRQLDKKQYQRQVSYLSETLGNIRSQNQRYRATSDSLQSINKQIHLIQQILQILMTDPKISISRFSHHITALHRQAFTRQVQKVSKYQGIVSQCGNEIKANIQYLKLSVNTVNKGYQITFSERKPPHSTSILGEK